MERDRLAVLLVAGVGGSAANWMDVATTLTNNGSWSYGIGYFVGVAIFFGMGSFVGWVFGETNRARAFFVGLSMPALISAAHTQATAAQSQREPAQREPREVVLTVPAASLRVLPVLHAQPQNPQTAPHSQNPVSPDSLRLHLRRPCPGCAIHILDEEGRVLREHSLDLLSAVELEVPPDATQFGIWNRSINPQLWPLSPEHEWDYEFDYRGNLWNDIRRGLGNYNVRPYDAFLTSPQRAGQR